MVNQPSRFAGLRGMAAEALPFSTIGGANALVYLAITWFAMPIGVVKSNVLAAVITTTLAYFANRCWTYRRSPRGVLSREYALFFGFNVVGMVIQAGGVAVAKYGLHLKETADDYALIAVTVAGLGAATVFRFWAYRTFVFLRPQADREAIRTKVGTPVPTGR